MQKYTFVKISSILQCQSIPQGIRIRLENHFFNNWRHNNTSQKTKNKFFENFFEVSGKLNSAKKGERGAVWDFLNIHAVENYQKIEGGPFGKSLRKKSHKAEITCTHKNFWSRARLEPTSFRFPDLKKF